MHSSPPDRLPPSGPSLPDCLSPPAPPSRLPTLEARRVEVIRSGGRTVGVSVELAPNTGDLGRGWPGAKEEGVITNTIRYYGLPYSRKTIEPLIVCCHESI